MSSLSALRPGVLTGLILLTCWLGWVTTSFAALGRRPAGDEAAVTALLEDLRAHGQLPDDGAATALLLRDPACRCDDDPAQAWAAVSTALHAHGGHAITATTPAALAAAAGAPTLVLLAADGSLRYAGPLAPPALTCGRAAVPLATALPGLLSGRGPPLILPSRCSC